MFTYEECESLFSPSAKNTIVSSNVYDEFAQTAGEIIISRTGIKDTDKPAWAKVPFVFIIEYLLFNRMNTNLTPEYLDKVKTNYKIAMDILDRNITTANLTSSKIGYMEGMYGNEL